MRYSALFLLTLVVSLSSYAQTVLRGVVKDAEKGQPLAGASIFLSNTSVGTTSNSSGGFELYVPAGRYDLIVSSIGFETFTQSINAAALPGAMTIQLKPKAQLMETVVIEQFEKNGWEKWGRFFLDYFIGTSSYASQCKLKNPGVLRFRNSTKDGELTVIALEPLVIENKALGYNVRYQLEEFSYNFRSKLLLYTGYPLFEPMQGSKGKMENWDERRAEVYEGSIMHFMRSLYRNRIKEEGFNMWRLKKHPNIEKQRVSEIYKQRMFRAKKDLDPLPPDSLEYYGRIIHQDNEIEEVLNAVSGDSIAYGLDSLTAALEFPDYILIHYPKKTPPKEYQQLFPKNGKNMLSQIYLMNGQPVEVHGNGMYYNPIDLLSLGYWAWAEKISTMLPFDYRPK